MKKINIKDVKLKINTEEVLSFLKKEKNFEIDIDGKLNFENETSFSTPIVFLYKLNKSKNDFFETDLSSQLNNIFNDYKICINKGFVYVDLLFSWQKIISLNKSKMLYFDHHSDGVEVFEDKELEEIGWQATACDISYRTLCDFVEEKCEGTLLFYENDIQFNGFAIINDLKSAKTKVKEFIVQQIKEKMKNDLIDLEDEDIIEALEYFEIEV